MQPTASTLVLIATSFTKRSAQPEKLFGPGGFYQQIVSRPNDYALDGESLDEAGDKLVAEAGDKLVALADSAYALRQMGLVEAASHMLLKPPAMIPHIDSDPAVSCMKKFVQLTAAEMLWVIAALKDKGGRCRGSLADYEDLLRADCAVGFRYRPLQDSYLNGLAARMCEAVRMGTSPGASENTLESRYVTAYAEFHETRKEMAKREYRTPRSFLAINQSSIQKENVLHLPAPRHEPGRAMPATGGAKILKYTDWKNKMGKEPNGNEKDGKALEEMTAKEMIYRIINLFTHPGTSEEKRLEMVKAIENIASRPDHVSHKDSDKD